MTSELDTIRRVRELLEPQSTMTLATVDESGDPDTAPFFFSGMPSVQVGYATPITREDLDTGLKWRCNCFAGRAFGISSDNFH